MSYLQMLDLISLILTFQSLAVVSRTTRFNIQKFYMILNLRLTVLYGLSDFRALNRLVTEVESVYCAGRTESLYKPDTFRL
jgi:hypothetical protein